MATWQVTIIPKQREKANPDFILEKMVIRYRADDYGAAETIAKETIHAQQLDGLAVIDELVEMAQ